ncbi:hypothetical protein CYMTET_11058 [Cymbomonas tetramitiformis]|uniref:CHCH domain-containing protein n=1 Tax=Cymbomonas tetramitiformis TaxID=36881 RepID=A0AAE0GPF0_9CHLO|nr:hypothetical protein CYMTET_11058 [Cymbomonas tetramitiformis]
MPRSRAAPPPRPAARAPPPSPPPPAAAPPPPAPMQQQQSGGGMMSGIGGMVAQGMAMGAGSAIGHKAVDGVFGAFSGGSEQPQAPPAPAQAPPMAAGDVCINHNKAFQECLQGANGDISKCQFYWDMLNQCKATGQA